MRTFEHPNLEGGWKCPICGTSDDKEIVLIPIVGTEEGNISRANQYHLDCIELREYIMSGSSKEKMIGQAFIDISE